LYIQEKSLFLYVLKLKGIKNSIKIFIIVTVSILTILLTPAILLQFSSIQNFVVSKITHELSRHYQTRFSVGNVKYTFFNTLHLQDMLVEDQSGDTLLRASSFDAEFNLWKLFRKKVSISSLTLNEVNVHLQKQPDGTMNFAFLFAHDEAKKDSTFIQLNVEQLKIKNSALDYSDHTNTKKYIAFNPARMRFSDINSEISIASFSKDSMSANLRHLSLNEISGFQLNNLSFLIRGSNKGIKMYDFLLKLPDSEININNIALKAKTMQDVLALDPSTNAHIPVSKARIALNDLKAFVPGFAGSREAADISAILSGRLSNLKVQDIQVEYGKSFKMDASLEVSGLPNLEESFIYTKVNRIQINHSELQDLISRIQNRPFIFPKEVRELGTISYQGNITGFLSDLVAFGVFRTNLGTISSDISLRFENHLHDLYYNGSLQTSGFNLSRFLGNDQLGTLKMKANTKGTKIFNAPFKGTLTATVDQLDYNKYSYTNARFAGEYDGNGFNGNITLKDENIDADFSGILDFRNPRLPVFNFDLMIKNTNLHALNLIKNYPGSRLSFHGTTNLTGNNLDNLNGNLQISDLAFSNQNDSLQTGLISFNSRTGTDYTNISIASEYLTGSISGDFKYSTIGNTFKMVLARYLPSLDDNEGAKKHVPNNVHIDLKLVNTNEITRVLQLPYRIGGVATFKGNINEAINKIELNASVDAVSTGKQQFENFTLNLSSNKQQQLELTGRTQMYDQNDNLQNISITASAAMDLIDTRLFWQNNSALTNAGQINTRTRLKREFDELTVNSRILPTEIIISDSIWNLRASEFNYRKSEGLHINNFMFESQRQYIHINGIASENSTDSVLVSMNDLNVDYVMRLINVDGISIGGLVTGDLLLYSLLKEPIYLADIVVENLSLNDYIIGDGAINTHWNKEQRQLDIKGDILKADNSEVANISGSYTPANDSLDIRIGAKAFPVNFLNRYFEGVASNFSGLTKGNFRIFGPSKILRFEGDLMVSNGKVTIDMLQTTYRFNDRVVLTPYNIAVRGITLFDEEQNRARLNGNIAHNGSFDKMEYDVSIVTDNLLVMNTTSRDDDFFYGKAFASGQARIFGDFSEANIVVNGVSRPRTKCYLSMASSSSVLEGDFIRFEKKQNIPVYNPRDEDDRRRMFSNENRFNVKTDIQIELTPEAEIEILVDPRAGDKITGRGRGNLRIRFDTFSDVELFGTVELEQGNYLFTLQTVIRKEFRINRGSTISWTGDPFEAQVNINGYYPLTASLTDLLEPGELQQITSRSTVPVHCLLYLTDDLMSPTIRFGIDLPSSDESVKSRVSNIVNTEEMMNRQILYLLLFHKFFTPDYMRSTAAVGVNEGLSFATATFSAQVNNWIQSTLNTNIFSIGVDWQKTNAESDEVKAQILIQPNNRLVINGNIGYRNDNISENKFIGDFDLEYKLIESGKLRFTAYNHTIDRAQLREAKTTRGVGLIYREDFNNLREMVEYYWGLMRNVFEKKKPVTEELSVTSP